VAELLGMEDEIVSGMAINLLEQHNDPRQIQIQITPFLEDKSEKFVTELWKLLLSAQTSVSGIPEELMSKVKEEIKKKEKKNEIN